MVRPGVTKQSYHCKCLIPRTEILPTLRCLWVKTSSVLLKLNCTVAWKYLLSVFWKVRIYVCLILSLVLGGWQCRASKVFVGRNMWEWWPENTDPWNKKTSTCHYHTSTKMWGALVTTTATAVRTSKKNQMDFINKKIDSVCASHSDAKFPCATFHDGHKLCFPFLNLASFPTWNNC